MPSLRLVAALVAAAALGAGAVASLSGGASPPAVAAEAQAGPLAITGLWARATPPGAPTAAGYLTVANPSATADRLLAIASPAAATAEIHEMRMENDLMIMRPAAGGVEIPAGGTVTLAPGGLHVMFVGIGAGFRVGETIPVTLTFARAGSVDTVLEVLPIGSPGPAAAAAPARGR